MWGRHSGEGIPFVQLAAAGYDEELLPPDVEPGLEFNASYTLPDNPYAFGAHVAVVEVAQDTGAIKILRYVAVNAVATSRAINDVSHAATSAAFTRPTAVADFACARMRAGILYGTSIDTECSKKTAISTGSRSKPSI